jgi:hypothetical protein
MISPAWLRHSCGLVSDRRGSAAPLFAIAIIPVFGALGAAVDYSRATVVRTGLQSALDSALLAAARDESQNWQQIALDLFNANVSPGVAQVSAPVFAMNAGGQYSATVNATLATHIVGLIGVSAIEMKIASVAAGPGQDSCILTLDKGSPTSNVSLSFGGAPNVNLTGCAVRSNTSLSCNGHAGNALASIGAGAVEGCANPRPNARVVPDMFAGLAEHIEPLCGNFKAGAEWTPGTPPQKPNMLTVYKGSYVEYHVCGDLTVSGSGVLTGDSVSSDSVIVIENGDLIVSRDASISTVRTAIVFTGTNQSSAVVDFPNGEGQSATLSLSPPIDSNNPWRGIAMYRDPALTKNVDDKWGPGASFNADGVVYLPNTNMVMHGVAGSGNNKCTKFVTRTFTTSGSAALNFSQQTDGCKATQTRRWADVPARLAQ